MPGSGPGPLLLLVVFTVVEARFSAQPMLPLRLFRTRRVTAGNIMLLLFGAIAIAMWYFTSLFLQNVLGFTALRAGLGPMLLIAVGIGLTFPALMAAATADAPEGDAGTIGGLASTYSQVGGSVGLAALATAASARAAAGGSSPAAALAAGYDLVFLIAAGIGLAIAVVSVLLPRGRPVLTRHAAPDSGRLADRAGGPGADPWPPLQDGSANQEYRAREVSGDEKALWWRRAVNAYPDYAGYQRKRGPRS